MHCALVCHFLVIYKCKASSNSSKKTESNIQLSVLPIMSEFSCKSMTIREADEQKFGMRSKNFPYRILNICDVTTLIALKLEPHIRTWASSFSLVSSKCFLGTAQVSCFSAYHMRTKEGADVVDAFSCLLHLHQISSPLHYWEALKVVGKGIHSNK